MKFFSCLARFFNLGIGLSVLFISTNAMAQCTQQAAANQIMWGCYNGSTIVAANSKWNPKANNEVSYITLSGLSNDTSQSFPQTYPERTLNKVGAIYITNNNSTPVNISYNITLQNLTYNSAQQAFNVIGVDKNFLLKLKYRVVSTLRRLNGVDWTNLTGNISHTVRHPGGSSYNDVVYLELKATPYVIGPTGKITAFANNGYKDIVNLSVGGNAAGTVKLHLDGEILPFVEPVVTCDAAGTEDKLIDFGVLDMSTAFDSSGNSEARKVDVVLSCPKGIGLKAKVKEFNNQAGTNSYLTSSGTGNVARVKLYKGENYAESGGDLITMNTTTWTAKSKGSGNDKVSVTIPIYAKLHNAHGDNLKAGTVNAKAILELTYF